MKITPKTTLAAAMAGLLLWLTGCDEPVSRGLRNWVNDPPRVLLVAGDALVYIDFPWLWNTANVVTVKGVNLPRGAFAFKQPRQGGGLDLPDPDEWSFDPWDVPDPIDDIPLPEPPDPFDDPWDISDIPEPPPFPEDNFDMSNFGDGSMTTFDNSGEQLGYAVVQRAASSQTAVKSTRIRIGANPVVVRTTPDRKRSLVTQTGGLAVIDRVNRVMVDTIPLPPSAKPWGLAITPDGARAYVTSFSDPAAVYAVDLASKQVIATIPLGAYPNGVAVTPDGSQVWVTSFFSDNVTVIDVLTNTKTMVINGVVNAWGIVFNRIGTRAYVTGAEQPFGTLKVIDTERYSVIASVQVGSTPRTLAVTPSGNHILVANWGGDTVSQIDARTNTVVRTIKVGLSPIGFHFR